MAGNAVTQRQVLNRAFASWVARARVCLSVIAMGLAIPATAADKAFFPDEVSPEALQQQLQTAAASAKAANKDLLVVLGANWCHDSENFVTRKLTAPAVAQVVDKRYQTLLVNVGLYEQLQAQLDVLGIPVLYGTPTVIAIDSDTARIVNRDSLDTWRSADVRSEQEAVDYFSGLPDAPPTTLMPESPALVQANQSIDAFEQAQGKRITQAFAELGKMMAAMHPNPPTDEFLKKWDNLGAVRGPMPDDLRALRASARAQDGEGADPIVLEFPDYLLFTD